MSDNSNKMEFTQDYYYNVVIPCLKSVIDKDQNSKELSKEITSFRHLNKQQQNQLLRKFRKYPTLYAFFRALQLKEVHQ